MTYDPVRRLHTTETLGDLIEGQIELYMWCYPCERNALADLTDLAMRYGVDARIAAVTAASTCKVCGKKPMAIRMVHDGIPRPKAAPEN
jgi:hypothetical protein